MAISDSDLLQEYERFKALRERNAAGPAMIGGRDRAAYMRQYYEANKEVLKDKKRQYYEENKDLIAQKQRQYYEENKEVLKDKQRQYYEANKDLIAQKQRSYEARGLTRGERIKEIQRKYAGEGGIV